MRDVVSNQFFAYGCNSMPEEISLPCGTYIFKKIFKHDFFAVTALYESEPKDSAATAPNPRKVVLKLSRQQHFFGLPLSWLGQWLCENEMNILKRIQELQQVPKLISKYGRNGFIYEYIEGKSLDQTKDLPEYYFDNLAELLKKIHEKSIIYVDSNKRGNILLGDDNKPYLIDFQISLHIGPNLLLSRKFADYIRQLLQKADFYHLYKHKRKFSPEELRPDEAEFFYSQLKVIKLHRIIANPLRKARRKLLAYLYEKHFLAFNKQIRYNPEDNPDRFVRLSKK
jgi:hypothetical protein